MKRLKIIIQLFVLLMCLTNVGNAQQPLIIKTATEGILNKQVQDYKIYLHKFDTSKSAFVKFYQISKSNVRTVEISPDNNYIAIIESEKILEENLSTLQKTYPYLDKRYINYYVNSLTIVNIEGQVIKRINKDVQKITWHPDGEIIAYITGSYYEGGIGFYPESVYTFNLKTSKEKKIEGIKYPHALQWIQGDGSDPLFIRDLYQVDGKRVYKYDIQKEELTPTDHNNINFSPDGKYYMQYSGEEFDKFAVFESSTDEEITYQLPVPLQHEFTWLPGEGHYALQSEKQQINVYDIDIKTKKIVASYEGNLSTAYDHLYVPSDVILVKEKNTYLLIKSENNKILQIGSSKIDVPKH